MSSLHCLVTLIGIIWIVAEFFISSTKHSKDNSKGNYDRSSLLAIRLTTFISLFLSIFLSIYGEKTGLGVITWGVPFLGYFGLILMVAGLIIQWTAILTLKQQFTVNVTIVENHKLIDKGIYHFIRHPRYAGSLLSFLGLGLTLENWISVVVAFIPMLMVRLYRITIEEKVLIDHFGSEYIDYMKKTKRLIPKIY